MPRDEKNRPSYRIVQMLDAYDQLEAYVQTIETIAAAHIPADAWNTLPPRPGKDSIIEEKVRQHLTGSKVTASREHKRRVRLIEKGTHKLTPEREAEILAEVDAAADGLTPQDLTRKGLKL